MRCALMAFYKTFGAACGASVFCSMPILLLAFMIYSKACISDIESIFIRVDQLSRGKKSKPSKPNNSESPEYKCTEFSMLEYCKEAIDLHGKLNRYRLHFTRNFRSFSTKFLTLQTHEKSGRCNELYNFGNDIALGNKHNYFIASD